MTDSGELVTLRDGATVLVRPMVAADGPALLAFFRGLPEEDRQFLRDDVTRTEVIDRFVANLGDDTVFSFVAEHEGRIVGDGTLHRTRHGWATHVATIRVVVARELQRSGLGTSLARLLVKRAIGLGLDKLVAEVVDNQIGALRAFEKLGFYQEATLKGHVKDIHGVKHDLVVMANDVSHIWETMEALVADYSPTVGD
ncbi:MAG: GNAT family N-acetyltransferase [Candidatus Solibacter usitatus]|nr:GNAT family N-acetyltransferase [Candidatus Solibacter usitatus]